MFWFSTLLKQAVVDSLRRRRTGNRVVPASCLFRENRAIKKGLRFLVDVASMSQQRGTRLKCCWLKNHQLLPLQYGRHLVVHELYRQRLVGQPILDNSKDNDDE